MISLCLAEMDIKTFRKDLNTFLFYCAKRNVLTFYPFAFFFKTPSFATFFKINQTVLIKHSILIQSSLLKLLLWKNTDNTGVKRTLDNSVYLYFCLQVFTANSDRYTVVRNALDKPVITRYIRIHPKTWNSHISMRAEFYGCREGTRMV